MADGYFTPDLDTWDKAWCDVCGTELNVTRGVSGPTSFVMAMARTSRSHDLFLCPHRDSNWHQHVVALLEEKRKTKSPSLKSLIHNDAMEYVLTVKAPINVDRIDRGLRFEPVQKPVL